MERERIRGMAKRARQGGETRSVGSALRVRDRDDYVFDRATQVPPPQPTMQTDLDIGAEKSETITVSDFFFMLFTVEFYRYHPHKTAFGEDLN